MAWKKRPLFWVAIFVGAFLAVAQPSARSKADISSHISDATIYLAGRVDSEVEVRESSFGSSSYSFILKPNKIWKSSKDSPAPVAGKVWATVFHGADLRYGDVIAFSGQLRSPNPLRNPGGYNQEQSLARQGMHALFYSQKEDRLKILIRNQGHPVLQVIFRLKAACLRNIETAYSRSHAAILSALFFGVRSDLDLELKDLFLKTGTLHLLAVSGFNVGIVIATVLFVLKLFRVLRPYRLILALVAAWFYVLLVGPQSPVFRAGVMASVWLGGEILGRKSDALNSLGLSALVLWMFRPLEVLDPGFQLSYAAVAGMVIALPRLMPKMELFPGEKLVFFEKVRYEARLLFWTSAAAQAATLPILLSHFYMLAPWSILANVPAAFLVFLIFVVGALQIIFSFLFQPAAHFLSWVVTGLLHVLLTVLSFFERLPFSVWNTGKLNGVIWVALVLAILFFLTTHRFKPFQRLGGLIVAVCLCLGAESGLRLLDRSLRVTFLDVGQGDAAHIRFPDGSHWLVDAGRGRSPDMGRAVLLPYLRHEGVNVVERVLISHPQEDHIGGVSSLINEMRIKRYSDPNEEYSSERYQGVLDQVKKNHISFEPVRKGQKLYDQEGVEVEVLASGRPEGAKDINDASVIFRLRHSAGTILFTGDAGESGFERLLSGEGPEPIAILKVPHHGAKPGIHTTSYIQALSPKLSLISAGRRNLFGHPSSEMMTLLSSAPGHQIYRTDKMGAVRFVLDGPKIRVLDDPRSFA